MLLHFYKWTPRYIGELTMPDFFQSLKAINVKDGGLEGVDMSPSEVDAMVAKWKAEQ